MPGSRLFPSLESRLLHCFALTSIQDQGSGFLSSIQHHFIKIPTHSCHEPNFYRERIYAHLLAEQSPSAYPSLPFFRPENVLDFKGVVAIFSGYGQAYNSRTVIDLSMDIERPASRRFRDAEDHSRGASTAVSKMIFWTWGSSSVWESASLARMRSAVRSRSAPLFLHRTPEIVSSVTVPEMAQWPVNPVPA